MFGSDILELAIGLMFVYLILSLICSTINEMVMNFSRARATTLESGLKELLNSPQVPELLSKFYHHPLIFPLFKGGYNPDNSDNLPAYIPSKAFALAMLDIARQTPQGTNTDGSKPDALYALRLLIDSAGGDVCAARRNIEHWYDASMDRVSSWYKKRVQLVGLVVAILVAIVVNADTLTICQRLSTDKAVRDALVVSAQTTLQNQPKMAQTEAAAPSDADNAAAMQQFQKNIDDLKTLKTDLTATGLPLGWSSADFTTLFPCSNTFQPLTLGKKLVGWLLTAIALSLGAPFWFNILDKALRLNKKPADTPKPAAPAPPNPGS